MKSKYSKFIHSVILTALLSVSVVSCDYVRDDGLPECQTENRLVFRYDYNMKFADAFAAEVNSVKVWAFDKQGRTVWSDTRSGDELRDKNFYIALPLPPGTYDFLAWCGLEGNDGDFGLATSGADILSDLGTVMRLKEGMADEDFSMLYNDTKFTGLYHVLLRDVELTRNPSANEVNEIVLPLTKDTNYVKVLLQNLDGKEMDKEDFSFHITAGNSELTYENDVTEGTEEFCHIPWSLTSGEATMTGESGAEVTSVSSVLAELSTSRLMDGARSLLKVVRNTDGAEIISIPLVQYLLLVKGNYRPMDDQEYLDRQDEYSLTFFIDKDLNWYSKVGIYVNSWHVVPPQDTQLH